MKKRYILEILVVLLALVFPFFNSDKHIDIKDLQLLVDKSIDTSIMQQLDKKAIQETYQLTITEYVDYISYGPISYINVDEVTIFKQPDELVRKRILEKVEKHINEQIKVFDGYGEEQTKMLKKALIIEKGDYVICIVSNNQELKDKILESI